MIKRVFTLLMLISACWLVSRAENQLYMLEVGDFHELQIIDGLNVVYKCTPDSAGKAMFECSDALVNTIMFSNTKGKLRIERDINSPVPEKDLPKITVYSTVLQYAENDGDSLLMLESLAPCAVLKLRVIGNGNLVAEGIHSTRTEASIDSGKGTIVLSGMTRSVTLKNIGKGLIDAFSLNAETGSATILGTGTIECNVSNELTVKAMGTGKIYVKGDASIKKRSLGKVEVIKVE